jgi:uncharacterized protein (TIGR02996 family)
MDGFVADTDPDLRSLLAACQAADDPLPPLAALADWLDGRGDPRGPVVRVQARYWYVYYTPEGFERHYRAEAGDLQRRSDQVSRPVCERWLGLRGARRALPHARHTPYLHHQELYLQPAAPKQPRLRPA